MSARAPAAAALAPVLAAWLALGPATGAVAEQTPASTAQDLRRAMAEIRRTLDQQRAWAAGSSEAVTAELRAAHGRIDGLGRTLSDLRAERDTLRADLIAARQRIGGLKRERDDAAAEVEALRHRLAEAEGTAADADRRLQDELAAGAARVAGLDRPGTSLAGAPQAVVVEPEPSAGAAIASLGAAAPLPVSDRPGQSDAVAGLQPVAPDAPPPAAPTFSSAAGAMKSVIDASAFVAAGDRLSRAGEAQLRRLALIVGRSTSGVLVVGHTDGRGDPEANRVLSLRRAERVRDRLVELARIEPERVAVEGRGEEQPLADDASEEGRSANRRVEVYVAPP